MDTTVASRVVSLLRPSTTSIPSAEASTMAGRTSPLRAVRATTQITTQGCFCSYTGVPRAAATHCASVQDRDPDRWATLGCELPAFHARALTFATSEAPGRSSAVAGRFRRAGGERRASWEALRSRTPRGRDSVCPWGHGPPRCPHDANALRVIEIRLASPDTATVVNGVRPRREEVPQTTQRLTVDARAHRCSLE